MREETEVPDDMIEAVRDLIDNPSAIWLPKEYSSEFFFQIVNHLVIISVQKGLT